MTLSTEFVQAVREGQIEGLEWCDVEESIKTPDCVRVYPQCPTVSGADHLCAHLRRWMERKGWGWALDSEEGLVISSHGVGATTFLEEWYESELDLHVAAALWVLGREG